MTTENTTTEQTAEQIEEANKLAKIKQKFDNQEAHFADNERAMTTLRAFFVKHHDTIGQFDWKAYGWRNTEIKFDHYNQNPKDIAKAFGADGWKREHDRYTCGAVNWKKEVDGCLLIIENAENIKPKLIEEVKL